MPTGRYVYAESKSKPGEHYRIELDDLGFVLSCECPGYVNRRKCRHANAINKALSKRPEPPVTTCGGCACPLAQPAADCFCLLCEEMHGTLIVAGNGEMVRRKLRRPTDRSVGLGGTLADIYG